MNVKNGFEQADATGNNPLVLGGTVKGADGEQAAAIPNVTGGSTVDTECRAAVNAILAALRNTGLIQE